ncbi:MAG: NADH-quinone oxidoreductase subunit L [Deltaproteobacteria bacterium]|nr:NADH-quinone oxidoreductase subunit L [Deltaproteobacteria bacterium]MBI3076642.1 NADH-quinone oxidoreductase subunit L [Deltaproteobacteria bacterium]
MATYVLIALFAPLAGATVQIFLGRRLPRHGDWLCVGVLFVSFVASIPTFNAVWANPAFKLQILSEWLTLGSFGIPLGLQVDGLTGIMLTVVSFIAAFIHLYSVGYMHGDPRYSRYFAYLNFFTFSMLGLVLADNFFLIYVFWELVGLSSYLLIGFWFERPAAANAGKKAFIVNRVGDVGFFVGILLLWTQLGTFRFEEVFKGIAAGQMAGPLLTVTGLCVFLGAVGKSAQFPLHVWLPDAMEGPTPVSALIHAATMVAAGVYMVGRVYPVFTPDAFVVIAYVAGITAFFAGTIALTQFDIKRVIAYSTLSQLGYMMLGLATGGYVAGLFHLVTHAFFKALMFLAAGSVIHALHTQDLREMGGLRAKMPVTFWTMMAGSLALAGVPPFSGFFSKDAIIGATLGFVMAHPQHLLLALFAVGGALLTGLYAFRLMFLAFTGAPRDREKHHHAHESPPVMTVPLVVLAVFAVGAGWGGWFERLVRPPVELPHGPAGAHTLALALSLLAAGLGILLAYWTYVVGKISAGRVADRYRPVYTLLFNKYYVDELYAAGVVRPFLALTRGCAAFDLGVIDGFVNWCGRFTRGVSRVQGWIDFRIVDGAVNLVGNAIRAWGAVLRLVQTGVVQNYILVLLGGVLVILLLKVL